MIWLVLACVLTAIAVAMLFEIVRDWWGARKALKRQLSKRGRTHARSE